MNNDSTRTALDSLEKLFETSPGFMGKRWVNEEEFLTQMLILRAACNENRAVEQIVEELKEEIRQMKS